MAIGRVRVYWCSRVVEQHEVHIGGIIQFTGTELSHAEHREPAAACRIRRIVAGAIRPRRGQCAAGEPWRATGRHPRDRSESRVTRSSGQMPPMSAMAVARAIDVRLARRIATATRSRRGSRAGPLRVPGHGRRHDRIRTGCDECTEAGRLAHREIGKVGAVAPRALRSMRGHRTAGLPAWPLGAAELRKSARR